MRYTNDDIRFKAETHNNAGLLFGMVLIVVFIVIAGAAFTTGYLMASNRTDPHTEQLKVFWEAWDKAEQSFYYDKPSVEERLQGAIKGMIDAYNDPYTMYLPPVVAAHDEAIMSGQTGGIGANISQLDDGRLVIHSVKLGWPAEQAGMRAGDVILAVNGQSVTDQDAGEIISMIRGKLDTTVTINIQREGTTNPLSFTMKRVQINVLGTLLEHRVGYLSVAIFSRDTSKQVEKEMAALLDQHPVALIFDLRGNPGGYFDEAIKVADLFLTEGRIASERSVSGSLEKFEARDGDTGEHIPLVVLVDDNSASAAEIVAGALQDRHRAILIGTHTYGKGSVQQVFELNDGSQLRVTSGAWYSPSEKPLVKEQGLQPNILVKLPTPEEAANLPSGSSTDVIRDAAMQYILAAYGPTAWF